MKCTLTKKYFLIWNTIVIGVSALVVYGIFKLFMPEYYFKFYPIIPLFFYLFEVYSIFMFDRCRLKTPSKLLNVYLGVKFAKLTLSILLVLFYTLKIKEHTRDFVIVFFLFYIISLVFQCWFFILYESHKMRKKKNNKCLD